MIDSEGPFAITRYKRFGSPWFYQATRDISDKLWRKLIEEGKSNMIYFSTVKGSLVQANEYSLRLSELPNIAFYVKQEYTPVEDQEVGKNETN